MFETNNNPTPPRADRWHYNADEQGFELVVDGQAVRLVNNERMAAIATGLKNEASQALSAQVALRLEQIDGSDPRLTDFWAKAQEIADNHNWCDEFDTIAEELGGPSRERNFIVTFTYSYSMSITARDEDAAVEMAREYILNSCDISDLSEDSYELEED